ncbi:MAG: hypothetical protein KDI20_03860 [Pseudomonadales bacterium]|nr:hypothetical protein [Pseudomonadales bacterium]
MTELLLVGGQNSDKYKKGEAWGAYQAGVVATVNLQSGNMKVLVKDDSRPEFLSGLAEIGTVFKAASLTKDHLIVPSTTEVIFFNRKTWKEEGRISSTWFNDLHHVIPYRSKSLLVVNTGLDCIMEVDLKGELLNKYCVCAEESSRVFDDDVDYRRVVSTKPHIAHPNHVFYCNSHLYATRFKQKDAICLTDKTRSSFQIRVGNVHDGLVVNGLVYFTSTNGWVTSFDIETGSQKMQMDLNSIFRADRPLGWCRGIQVLDNGDLVVGFSRLRPTKFRENVDWIAKGVGFKKKLSPLPTRIAVVDPKDRVVKFEIDIEAIGMNAIFSIHVDKFS